VVSDHGTQLVVAGPVVTAVADDPEGARVLAECCEAWRRRPHHAGSRIALACLPMADAEENAIIVNALQRRPVVDSAVGGIVDQIVDGESGILLPDPTDLLGFAGTIADLLDRPGRLGELVERARQRVVDCGLPDSQLARWGVLTSAVRSQ
jgi:trehalose synthase